MAGPSSRKYPRRQPELYSPALLLWLIALAAAMAVLARSSARHPLLPLDLPVAWAVQKVFPLPEDLALWITQTADKPWCFFLAALCAVGAWLLSGWRAAALAVAVFFLPWLLALWLSPLVAQPRPSPELITVVGHPTGYAFPSVFAVVYMATFGYLGVLAWARGRGVSRLIVPVLAVLLLALGAVARIDLGAHWPSDILAGYLLGFWWILALLPLSRGDRD